MATHSLSSRMNCASVKHFMDIDEEKKGVNTRCFLKMASVAGVKETDAKPGGFFSTDLFVYTCMSAQCVLTCFKTNHLRHTGMKEVE